MTLEEYQRALVTLSFAAPAAATVGTAARGEGSAPGALPVSAQPPALDASFTLYRTMIRARLFAMARRAYARAWASAGEQASAASFARFLAARPPSSPFIREVVEAFAAFALQDAALQREAPRALPCLLRFEAAKWRAAGALWRLQTPVQELDFDGVLALNPTLELVALEHAVDDATADLERRDPCTLLVYRRRGEGEVRWYRAPALLADLLRLPTRGEVALATLVRALAAQHQRPLDEQLLDELTSALAVAVERGVVLGVRAHLRTEIEHD